MCSAVEQCMKCFQQLAQLGAILQFLFFLALRFFSFMNSGYSFLGVRIDTIGWDLSKTKMVTWCSVSSSLVMILEGPTFYLILCIVLFQNKVVWPCLTFSLGTKCLTLCIFFRASYMICPMKTGQGDNLPENLVKRAVYRFFIWFFFLIQM